MLLIEFGARLEIDDLRSLESLNLHGAAKDGLGNRDLLRAMNVVSNTFVALVFFQLDLDDEVADVPVQELVTSVLDAEEHAVVYRLGNLDFEFYEALKNAGAVAGFTLEVTHAAANATHAHLDGLRGDPVSVVFGVSVTAGAYVVLHDFLIHLPIAARADLDSVVSDGFDEAIIGLLKVNRNF